jgi:feruloyl esterase
MLLVSIIVVLAIELGDISANAGFRGAWILGKSRTRNLLSRLKGFTMAVSLADEPLIAATTLEGDFGPPQAGAPVASCESLSTVELPETTISMAQKVDPMGFKMAGGVQSGPGGPGGHNAPVGQGGPGVRGGPPREPFQPTDTTNHSQFCRVAATLQPSGDSDIKIEVWLPRSGWNGKYLAVGNFGWAGSIMYNGLLMGLEGGYAVASTDTGHDNSLPMGQFALGHPDKVIDYGYRAVHEMTLVAKALVKAYYGTAPRHSYFTGCSLGGQQALTEAQRFPRDYDGIVAGSPASPIAHLNAFQIWPSLLVAQEPSRSIPREKSGLIREAVLKACDELDGVRDGIIEDPAKCHFDPGTLLCNGEDKPTCLTAPQVDFLRLMYAGPINPRTGQKIYAPLAPGAEQTAIGVNGTGPMGVAVALFKYLVFQDLNWDWKTLDLERDVDFADKVLSTVNLAMNPNLRPFFDHGGKLLMYHGWLDGSSPMESVDYYNAVLKTVGAGEAENSIRLFNVPGMGHCMGGEGCDTFDKLGALDQWAETGKAPDRIVASKLSAGKVIRTHPLCAYPMVAKYKGSGSPDDAENFVCSN